MVQRRKGFNPFYVLVIVVGTLFVLTACGYWLSALRHGNGRDGDFGGTGGFEGFFEQWGTDLLIIEVAVLVVVSILAMGLDRWWSWRRYRGRRE